MLPPSPLMSTSPAPPEFLCPVSLELMDLPVVTCNGTTYERANIERWWFGCEGGTATDPATGVVVDNVHLVVNVQLYNVIRAWKVQHGVVTDEVENMQDTKPPPVVTMRTLMVDDGTQEARAFCNATAQLYSRHTEQREGGLEYLVDNWKTFPQSWVYCLLTSSAHLELLLFCTDGVAADCRWRAVLLLANLALLGHHARAVLVRCRYMETLLAAVRLPDATITTQATVAHALQDLANYKAHRPAMLERGVLSALLDMLYSESSTVTSRALGTLSRLMKTRKAAERLCNSTCVMMLVNVLDDGQRDEEVLTAAVECLTVLARLQGAKQRIATHRGAQHLLALLRRDAKHLVSVQIAAGSLLTTLVSDPDAGPCVVTSQGGVDSFIQVLTDKGTPCASKRIVRSALGQLAASVPACTGGVWGWWTGQTGPSASQAMVDNGGVAALVALATHPQEEHHVLALSTLRTLACARHMHNKIVFASQGALALMVRMLGSSKEALVQEAMLGLAELSADAKLREMARRAGAVERLRALASSTAPKERQRICQAAVQRLLGYDVDLSAWCKVASGTMLRGASMEASSS